MHFTEYIRFLEYELSSNYWIFSETNLLTIKKWRKFSRKMVNMIRCYGICSIFSLVTHVPAINLKCAIMFSCYNVSPLVRSVLWIWDEMIFRCDERCILFSVRFGSVFVCGDADALVDLLVYLAFPWGVLSFNFVVIMTLFMHVEYCRALKWNSNNSSCACSRHSQNPKRILFCKQFSYEKPKKFFGFQ